MPGIEQAGAVVRDGQFLYALHGSHILYGDRGVVAQHLEEGHGFPSQTGDAIIKQLDHSQVRSRERSGMQIADRTGKASTRTFHGKTRVVAGLRHNHRFAVLSHPAGNSLAHTDPQIAIAGRLAGSDRVVEILLLLVDDKQGP